MKRKSLVPAFLLLLFYVAGYTQQPAAPSVETLKAKIKTFKNHKRYGVRYDKFTDVTTVWFRFDINEGGRRLGATINFTGSNYHRSPGRFFVYEDRGRDWQHLEHADRQLYALIDGERLMLGEGDRQGEVSGYGVSVSERLAFPLNADTFNKIAAGRSVEFRVGRRQLEIKDEHRQAFRDLESLLKL